MASILGIADLLDRRPSQLSGGQRQRVAMGRAMIRRPKLFLMDEPLSNLDSQLRSELRAEISDLVRNLGVTCIYVTHDQAEALTLADRVAILRNGVLQDFGTPAQVYGRPATLSVAAFLGSPRMSLLEATVYVRLDQHVALRLGVQELLPPVGRPARPVGGALPRRTHRGRAAQRGADAGRVRHLRQRAARAHPASGAPWPRVDGVRRRRRDRRRGGRSGRDRTPGPRPRIRRLIDRLVRRAPDVSDPAQHPESGRHHRKPAELTIRLAPYPAVAAGHPLTLAVHTDALHFFDEAGPRIDVGRR